VTLAAQPVAPPPLTTTSTPTHWPNSQPVELCRISHFKHSTRLTSSAHPPTMRSSDLSFGCNLAVQCVPPRETLQESLHRHPKLPPHLVGLRHLRTPRTQTFPTRPGHLIPHPFPSLETLILNGGVGHKLLSSLGTSRENGSTDEDLSSIRDRDENVGP